MLACAHGFRSRLVIAPMCVPLSYDMVSFSIVDALCGTTAACKRECLSHDEREAWSCLLCKRISHNLLLICRLQRLIARRSNYHLLVIESLGKLPPCKNDATKVRFFSLSFTDMRREVIKNF